MNLKKLLSIILFSNVAVFASNKTEICQFKNPDYGVAEFRGMRKTMEDKHAIKVEKDCAFFGLYDGHGGVQMADFASKNLHEYFFDLLDSKLDIKTALENAFLKVDKETVNKNIDAGCTAICCYFKNNKLYVANAGDSRAVLSKNTTALPLSTDHKPELPSEAQRIVKSGGKVTCKVNKDGKPIDVCRVNGILSTSRALGDFSLKKPKQKEDLVIALPEVEEIDLEKDDEFVIIACDGLRDVVENQEAVNFVRSKILSGQNVTSIAEDLARYALWKKSYDNVSVIIVKNENFKKKVVFDFLWNNKIPKYIKFIAFIYFIYRAYRFVKSY